MCGKISVRKFVNKYGCFKHRVIFNRKPIQFLKNRSFLVYLLVFDTIVTAIVWNLGRLNRETPKSDLQQSSYLLRRALVTSIEAS